MKTAVVGGMIVGVHCVVIGSVIMMGGCGKTAGVAEPAAPAPDLSRVVMPPEEPVLTPPRVLPVTDATDVAAPSVEFKKYVVQKGDMLSSIAQRHGVTVREMTKLNSLSNPNKLKVGQELRLPAQARLRAVTPKSTPKPVVAGEGMQVYTVAKGDCLSKIAARCGTTTKDLINKNELTSDKLKVGQKLVVPVREQKTVVETPVVEPVVPEPAATVPVVEEPGATSAGAPDKAAPVVEPPVAAPVIDDVAGGSTHEVVEGETLQLIADKYAVSVDKLMSFNNLTSPDIKPPMTLKIPQVK